VVNDPRGRENLIVVIHDLENRIKRLMSPVSEASASAAGRTGTRS
jgi:hypothetical protein